MITRLVCRLRGHRWRTERTRWARAVVTQRTCLRCKDWSLVIETPTRARRFGAAERRGGRR